MKGYQRHPTVLRADYGAKGNRLKPELKRISLQLRKDLEALLPGQGSWKDCNPRILARGRIWPLLGPPRRPFLGSYEVPQDTRFSQEKAPGNEYDPQEYSFRAQKCP